MTYYIKNMIYKIIIHSWLKLLLIISLNFNSIKIFQKQYIKIFLKMTIFYLYSHSVFFFIASENESDDFSVNEGISQKFYLLDQISCALIVDNRC